MTKSNENLKTKIRILEGTYQYLLENGSQNFSARSVAKFTGVNHGLIHHYFGSKENLILAFIDFFSQKIIEKNRLDEPPASAAEGVRIILKNVVLNEKVAPVMTELLMFSREYPAVHQKIEAIMEERMTMLQSILKSDDPRDGFLLFALGQGLVAIRHFKSNMDAEPIISRIIEWVLPHSNPSQKEDS